MNKVLAAAVVVLFIAVSFLFYKVLNTTTVGQPSQKATKSVEQAKVAAGKGARIAFVYSDSINDGYLFIKEKTNLLKSEQQRLENTLNSKMQQLQQRFTQLNEKAATMTQKEMEAAQLELQQKEQEIQEMRLKMSDQLAKQELDLRTDLFKRVNTFLAEYNKEHDFDYILSYQEGGQIILAKDMLNITDAVVEGLNAVYKADKEKAKK